MATPVDNIVSQMLSEAGLGNADTSSASSSQQVVSALNKKKAVRRARIAAGDSGIEPAPVNQLEASLRSIGDTGKEAFMELVDSVFGGKASRNPLATEDDYEEEELAPTAQEMLGMNK